MLAVVATLLVVTLVVLAPPAVGLALAAAGVASLVSVPALKATIGAAGGVQERIGFYPLAVLAAPTIVGLPVLLPPGYAYGLICLFAACALPRLGRRAVSLKSHASLVFLYTALFLVAFLRSEDWGLVATWAPFLAFAGAVFLTADEREVPRLRTAIALSPAVFVTVNVVLKAVGVGAGDSLGQGPAVVLEQLGFAAERTLFPMSVGYADFGGAACLGLVGTLMLQRGGGVQGTVQRCTLMAASLVCLYGLLAVDVRGGVVAAVLSSVVVLAARGGVRRSLALVAVVIPFTAAIATTAVSAAAHIPEALQLNREGTDPSSLSSRTYIWDATTQRLASPSLDEAFGDLWGYGSFGPANEGLSREYAVFLPSTTNEQTGSTHNFAYQTIFDIGYVGLVVVVALFALTIAGLTRQRRSAEADALLAMVLAMIGLGVVDTSPSYASPQVFAIWLMVLLATARADRSDQTQPHSKRLPSSPDAFETSVREN